MKRRQVQALVALNVPFFSFLELFLSKSTVIDDFAILVQVQDAFTSTSKSIGVYFTLISMDIYTFSIFSLYNLLIDLT